MKENRSNKPKPVGKPSAKPISRRRFLKLSATGAVGSVGLFRQGVGREVEGRLSFGLVTDVHYADHEPRGNRHYRDSVAKLGEAVGLFNQRKLPFAIELGDLIDSAPSKDEELGYLHRIRDTYQGFKGDRHFVLGNHCLAALTKEEFLANCGARIKQSYYSFDHGPFHFVVLDGNFNKDGSPYAAGKFNWTDTWIHPPQQEWLAKDLKKAAGKKTVVFVHQNLDKEKSPLGVKNGGQVREILEASGNVLAVLQGHHHAGGYARIKGIHYVTLKATVTGPAPASKAYSIVSLDSTGRIQLEGFGQEESRTL